MEKSLEESARKRRAYVEQARAAFGTQTQQPVLENTQPESDEGNVSTLGIRCMIALLLFVCFVYFDQEKITFQGISAKEVVHQVEWNPLPTEQLEQLFTEIDITGVQDEKK